MHTCDNKLCVNPNHLRLGTIADNNQDMTNKRRHAFGRKNGRSKIKLDDVLEINSLYKTGKYTQKQLTKMFS